MNSNQLKNMVVLKNLPSNIVDEAFIILKSNKKIKSLERIEKNSNSLENKIEKEDYIVKEAEMVISNFLSGIEHEKNFKNHAIKQIENKYKRLKLLTFILGVMLILNTLVSMF